VVIDRLAIVGTGLIGGSIGLASLKRGLVSEVDGFDVKHDRLQQALQRGAITNIAPSAADAARLADLVVLASPVKSIPTTFAQISASLKPGTIVTDVGSAKSRIVEEIQPSVPDRISFIAGHPLAGSQEEGVEAADPDMFVGAAWLLTPIADHVDQASYEALSSFIQGLGATPLAMDPSHHDELIGLMSHLPQVVASALAGFAGDHVEQEMAAKLAAGGFRDTTRVAASSPELWIEILSENREHVLDLVAGLKAHLGDFEKAIQAEDWSFLKELLTKAQTFRTSIPKKPGVAPAELFELTIAIPDRPGVLGEITELVGEAGVNIEDLQISHSPGGRGTLHLFIKGEEPARLAQEVVSGPGGFEVHRTS
jgi:prephenate dehydrogenase